MIDTSGRAAALWALIATAGIRDCDTGILATAERCPAQRHPGAMPRGL